MPDGRLAVLVGMAEGGETHGLGAYRRVLAAPLVLPLLSAQTVATMPAGMGAVALVLYVHDVTASFAAAGVVAGAFTIGLGLTGPVLARAIDRVGTRPILLPAALLEAASLVALVLLGRGGAGPAALALAAALAGAAAPPVGGVVRQRWPELVTPSDLPTAYAVDAIQVEVIFIAGPLLAGALAATVGPGDGLLVAAGLGAIGMLWFVLLLRGVAPPAKVEHRHHGWAGALGSATVRLLILTGVPLGATFGALDVALPAFGVEHGAAALGGPFAAALAVGSALGGLALGARPRALGGPGRAYVTLSLVQFLTCLPLLAATAIPEMFVFSVLSGVCVAPLVASRSQIVQARSLPGTTVEAFTWMGLSLTVGASAGSAIAGPVVTAGGWRAGVAIACLAPAVAGVLALAGRHLLEVPERSVEVGRA